MIRYTSLLLFVLLLGFVSCKPGDEVKEGGIPLHLGNRAYVEHSTDFAFDFFRRINQVNSSENVFVSPLSLHIALGMLLNGAEKESYEEIKKVLRLTDEEYNSLYKILMEGLPKVDNRVTVNLANSVWYRQDKSVEASYTETLKQYFQSEVKPLTTVGPVNDWARQKTNNKINKILDTVDPDLFMLLMNAVYFKGDWKNQFKTSNTRDESFSQANGTKKQVKMMHQENSFGYAQMPGYTACELPYGNGDYRMTILLPNSGQSVDSLVQNYTTTHWNELQKRLQTLRVQVALPRFEINFDSENQLNGILQQMGMSKVFSRPEANLTKIRPQNDLFVGFIKQKAYISTDEKGSEAAAVTAIGVFGSTSVSTPPAFICNRPFAFFISEKNSNVILFAGKVATL
ncbi:serpin family protein [Siphonobacter sp.]|uniref:serpin family protein n=1 Tax=Siphonobacter sp. TaxID=1869184 RepID=UPI003B3B4F08